MNHATRRLMGSRWALLLCLTGLNLMAQIPVGKELGSPLLLKGATLHLGTGEVVESGILGIKDGKISLVASTSDDVDSSGYEVVDVTGQHIYPGFILPNSDLGLVEVDALRATKDFSEEGAINPNVRSLISYNTDSELIPTMRFTGIVMANVMPRGGLVSGTSSVMALDGWNWEDAVYKADAGIHVHWPGIMSSKYDWAAGKSTFEKNKQYEEAVNLLEALFRDSLAYSKAPKESRNTDLKLAAMEGLFDGSQTLFLHSNHARTIVDGVLATKRWGVKRTVVVGASQALSITDFLNEHKIPVILSGVHRLPRTQDTDVNMPYKLPGLLKKAGVDFCLGYDIEMLSSSRNLPFFAGTAVAWGLPKEDAIKALTLDTARILGIDKTTGSLEVGKDANLFVSKGDALDMRGNILTFMYIRGRDIPLDGMQQRLYKHFKARYSHE